MTKASLITIHTLNINLTIGGASAAVPSDLLASLLAGLNLTKGDDERVDSTAVLALLSDNPMTVVQVKEHFGMAIIAAQYMLGKMTELGQLAYNPDDGTYTTVKADIAPDTTAPAEEAASSQVAPESAIPSTTADVTSTEVLAFLRSDSRFEYRTLDAIRNYFGDRADEALDVLDNLVAHDLAICKRRRADSAGLYKAAEVAAQATTTEAATEAATQVFVNRQVDDVLAFLRSDDRYEFRTYKAVNEYFGGSAVDSVLSALIHSGQVITKRRRADGETLYKATAVAVPHATTEAQERQAADVAAAAPLSEGETEVAILPEIVATNVRQFLTGLERFTQRSFGAIAKHFGASSSDDLQEKLRDLLSDMASEGDIGLSIRRRDGKTLYKAA